MKNNVDRLYENSLKINKKRCNYPLHSLYTAKLGIERSLADAKRISYQVEMWIGSGK